LGQCHHGMFCGARDTRPRCGLTYACFQSKMEGYPDDGCLGGCGRGAGCDSDSDSDDDDDDDDDDTMGLYAGSGKGSIGLKADAGIILKIAGDAGGCDDDSDASEDG
jgi:hypothetical protein